MVNNGSTKITPPQNIKTIPRGGSRTGDLRENTDQIGIRFLSFATNDLSLTLHIDLGEVCCSELPYRSVLR
jgi:hypothetical protein